MAGHDLQIRWTGLLIAIAICAGLLVGAGTGTGRPRHHDDPASKHHAKKRIRVGGSVALNETPVQSGRVAARRGCRRSRFVEIRRASNDALLATATTTNSGSFAAPGGYSGQAYALARSSAHKQGRRKAKIKCLDARSPVISIGVGDLVVTQVAVPGAGTGGNPAYDVTVTNLGPDTAQGIVIAETPKPVPANGQFTLNTTYSAAGCSLAAGTAKCPAGSLAAGKSATRRIAFSCSAPTHFNAKATASSSARDPNASNSTTPNVVSVNCP